MSYPTRITNKRLYGTSFNDSTSYKRERGRERERERQREREREREVGGGA